MNIHLMLNPIDGSNHSSRRSASQRPTSLPTLVAPTTPEKRQRVPKDALIFSDDAKPVGIVNFLPCETADSNELMAQHRRFRVSPLGDIFTTSPRTIPYNSNDQKFFLNKAGREAFQVFQYSFYTSGNDREWKILWDYNVGLVRMTDVFKSCKHKKTIPAKAIKANDGLSAICCSVTGGVLLGQGYWVPYHAAKALAATFCYDVRSALTPVFGNDFPSLCLHPNDPRFGKFRIEPSIVQHCIKETDRFKKEKERYRVSTIGTQFRSPVYTTQTTSEQPARPAGVKNRYRNGTDPGRDEKYLFSPHVSSPSQDAWVSTTRSPSPCSPLTTGSSAMSSPYIEKTPQYIPSVTSIPYGYYAEPMQTKRTHSKVALIEECDEETIIDTQTTETVYGDSTRTFESFGGNAEFSQTDMNMAEALLSLRAGDNAPPSKRTRHWSHC